MEIKTITFAYKYDFKNYLKYCFLYTYTRPLIVSILILSFIFLIGLLTGVLEDSLFLIYSIFFLVGTPPILYYTTRIKFYSNKMLAEVATYTISRQGVRCKGESYEINYTW